MATYYVECARSAINRRTASAFSASDNGSEAIIASAAENESPLIGSNSARLETAPPTTSPRSFPGELVQPVVQPDSSVATTPCRQSVVRWERCVRNAEVEGSTPFRSTETQSLAGPLCQRGFFLDRRAIESRTKHS